MSSNQDEEYKNSPKVIDQVTEYLLGTNTSELTY